MSRSLTSTWKYCSTAARYLPIAPSINSAMGRWTWKSIARGILRPPHHCNNDLILYEAIPSLHENLMREYPLDYVPDCGVLSGSSQLSLLLYHAQCEQPGVWSGYAVAAP